MTPDKGACKNPIKDQTELSGMRWTQPGAEALLHLRSVAENGDWEAFHIFRRNQRERLLYGQQPQSRETELEQAVCRASLQLVDCQAA